MIKIKLRREGRNKLAFYRIVVAVDRTKAKGKYLDLLGYYNSNTKEYSLDENKLQEWIRKGAQPADGFTRFTNKVKSRYQNLHNDFKNQPTNLLS